MADQTGARGIEVASLYATLELQDANYLAAVERAEAAGESLERTIGTSMAKAGASGAAGLDVMSKALDRSSKASEAVIEYLGGLQRSIEQGVARASASGSAAVRALAEALERQQQAADQSTESNENNFSTIQRANQLFLEGSRFASTRAASITALIRTEASLIAELQRGNLTLEQTIRAEGLLAQTRRNLAAATNQSTAAMAAGGTAAVAASGKYAKAGTTIAFTAQQIVLSGSVGAGAINALGTAGTALATKFGPVGIIASVIVAGLGLIIGKFREARAEAKQAEKDFADSVARSQDDGNVEALTKQARRLIEGSASKGFADGLTALQGRFDDANAKYQRAVESGFSVFAGSLKKQRDAAERELNALTSKIDAVRSAILAPGPSLERTVTPITTTARGAGQGYTAKDAEQDARAFRELADAYQDVITAAQNGDTNLVAFDKAVRELSQRFTGIKRPTADMRQQFRALVAELGDARSALVGIQGDAVAFEVRKIIAALTPDTVDDFTVAMEELEEQLRKKGIVGEQAEAILALKRALEEAERAAETTRDVIAATVSSSLTPVEKLRALTQQRVDLQRQETELIGKTGPEADAKRLKIAQLLLQIEQAMAEVGEQNAGNLTATEKAAFGVADALSAASSFAFGMATSLLGSENSVTRMLGGVNAIAAGFSDIARLARDAGSLGKLFSSGAGLASAIPAIGGIVGGIGAVASLLGSDKAKLDEERQRHRETLEVLQGIKDNTGDLRGKNLSGNDLLATRAVLDRILPILRTPQSGRDLIASASSGRPLLTAKELAAIKKAAEELGIPFANTRGFFEDLKKALDEIDFRAFRESFAGALEQLELLERVGPATSDLDKLADRIKLVQQAGGALADLTKTFDLSSAAGRNAAIADLIGLIKALSSGAISNLGGLTLDETLKAIEDLIVRLQGLQPKAVSAFDKFGQALEALGVQVEFGTLTVGQKLEKAKALFARLFPDLAQSIDTTSVQAFERSIQAVIDGFAADGELTEAEKAQIAIIRLLAEAFKAATPAAEAFIDAIDSLGDEFEILGTDAATRFQRLKDTLGAEFSEIGELLEGIDPSTKFGQQELAKRAELLFSRLAEGGITESEQRIIDAIKRILGAARDIADEQAQSIADAADRARDARQRIIDGAEDTIRLRDITDPVEQLRIRLAAVAKAFPQLADKLNSFDLSTQEGRDALSAWIVELTQTPGALDALAKSMGLTVEELLQALIGIEEGADAAAIAVTTLAEKLQTAFDEVDFEVALEGIVDPIEKLKLRAAAAAKVIPSVAEALAGLDLASETGRKAAEAALVALGRSTTDATVRAAILELLGQIRGIEVNPEELGAPASDAGVPQQPTQRTDSVRVATLAEDLRFSRLLDYQARIAAGIDALVSLSSLRGFGGITPPFLPPGFGTGAPGDAGRPSITIVINVNNAAPIESLRELQDAVTQAALDGIDYALGKRVAAQKYLAGNTALT